MKPFAYANPKTIEEAVKLLGDAWGKTEVLAGGTDLVTSLKQNLTSPDKVVSLKDVEGLSGIVAADGSLKIGATTKLKDLIANAEVKKNFPCLVTAAESIGSPQIINVGTVGGDLLQRPRCWFFRQGYGLFGTYEGAALVPDGDNRYHAIFDNKGPAQFVNPSSLAPGLIALGATVRVHGPSGTRDLPVAELFATPKADTDREYTLKPNEILTYVSIPMKGLKNATYEIRQRIGLDWPMVTASVAYEDSGGKAANAKVVLGHVAPTPWVSDKAAAALNGQAVGEDSAMKAGAAAAEGATPLSMNGYKVHQVKVVVKRAVMASMA